MNVNVSELGPSPQCTELAHRCIELLNRAHPKNLYPSYYLFDPLDILLASS